MCKNNTRKMRKYLAIALNFQDLAYLACCVHVLARWSLLGSLIQLQALRKRIETSERKKFLQIKRLSRDSLKSSWAIYNVLQPRMKKIFAILPHKRGGAINSSSPHITPAQDVAI